MYALKIDHFDLCDKMTFTFGKHPYDYEYDVFYFQSKVSNLIIKLWNYNPLNVTRDVLVPIHMGLYGTTAYMPFEHYTNHISDSKDIRLDVNNLSLIFTDNNFDLYCSCNSKEDAILLKLEL